MSEFQAIKNRILDRWSNYCKEVGCPPEYIPVSKDEAEILRRESCMFPTTFFAIFNPAGGYIVLREYDSENLS